MLTKFWETVGEQIGKRWVGQVFVPALVFWVGGIFALIYRQGFCGIDASFLRLGAIRQAGLLLVGLLIVIASGMLMQHLTLPLLHILEGNWPRPVLDWIGDQVSRWQRRRISKAEWRRSALSQSVASPHERRELAKLEMRLNYTPVDSDDIMPTSLGNILKAAETSPAARYGLDVVVCWPRLWLLLPDAVREELSKARAQLDEAVRLWAWGVFFICWTKWAWWALPIGLLVAAVAYYVACNAAVIFADLLEAAFDLYRWELYKAVRWPLPANTNSEESRGRDLTAYLWRGADEMNKVTFTKGPPRS